MHLRDHAGRHRPRRAERQPGRLGTQDRGRSQAWRTRVRRDRARRLPGEARRRQESLRADLPDLIRFLFGTGCRFGEALAVRWYDLNLTEEVIIVVAPDGVRVKLPPHTVFFNGNIVHVKGEGLVRNEGKTASSRGIISLPDFLHTLLLVRAPAMATTGAGTMEPVFPSGLLGWRHPSNVQRSVRRLRLRIGYPDFTTHVGRKTVGTVLAKAGHSSRQVADQRSE